MKPLIYTIVGTLVLTAMSAGSPAIAAETSAKKQVLAAIDVWKHALMKRDRAALEQILHPELTYGHSDGLVENKDQQIRHVIEGKATYKAIPISDTKIQVYGDFALVTTKMEYYQNTAGKLEIVKLQVLMAWLKGPSGWQMIGRQSTRPHAK